MKHLRLSFLVLGLLSVTALATQAAQVASAKVLSVNGTVTKELADGSTSPLKSGDILVQGESILTSGLSRAQLVFSNGSTLLVEDGTSLSLIELSQTPFGGNKSYEQLAGDPSKSQTLLELNYGSVDGHVKKLQPGSKFDIMTPLGTAAIRGTKFRVSIKFGNLTKTFTLQITNKDGEVEYIDSDGKTQRIGLSKPLTISVQANDPKYAQKIKKALQEEKKVLKTVFNNSNNNTSSDDSSTEDISVIVVSPEGPSI